MHYHSFTFNPFEENTFLLWDEKGNCCIIDPGCYYPDEKRRLLEFIIKQQLSPVMLLLTHAHLDHIFGCAFINETFHLKPHLHLAEKAIYESAEAVGRSYGVPVEKLPEPVYSVQESNDIFLGDEALLVLETPGHSPGGVCFVHEKTKTVMAGDALFYGSIGRTDLPGGNYETLMHSIKSKILSLPDDYKVYSGHGPSTTIGHEKYHNPFLV